MKRILNYIIITALTSIPSNTHALNNEVIGLGVAGAAGIIGTLVTQNYLKQAKEFDRQLKEARTADIVVADHFLNPFQQKQLICRRKAKISRLFTILFAIGGIAYSFTNWNSPSKSTIKNLQLPLASEDETNDDSHEDLFDWDEDESDWEDDSWGGGTVFIDSAKPNKLPTAALEVARQRLNFLSKQTQKKPSSVNTHVSAGKIIGLSFAGAAGVVGTLVTKSYLKKAKEIERQLKEARTAGIEIPDHFLHPFQQQQLLYRKRAKISLLCTILSAIGGIIYSIANWNNPPQSAIENPQSREKEKTRPHMTKEEFKIFLSEIQGVCTPNQARRIIRQGKTTIGSCIGGGLHERRVTNQQAFWDAIFKYLEHPQVKTILNKLEKPGHMKFTEEEIDTLLQLIEIEET